MKNRFLKFPERQSFFVFGARGVGKSTLIQQTYANQEYWLVDLLDQRSERKYMHDPSILADEVRSLSEHVKIIVIDEIQKIPSLLDVVHQLIESTDKQFVLTGSSARKLKHGHANLLAGRAFVRYMFPFSFLELEGDFELSKALQFGMLPKVWSFKNPEDCTDFLRAYAHVYLKEEVWGEHLIRKLEPFQYFLETAAQSNGQVINYAKMSRDSGVDAKTIAEYYSILDDTMLGFHLPAYRRSFRKRLAEKPKFYFFDTGVNRALARCVEVPVSEGTYEYGKLFEQFVLLEAIKLAKFYFPDFRFSHLRAHDGLEIDLVVERPGQPILMLEIKSDRTIKDEHLRHLQQVKVELGGEVECVCFSNIDQARLVNRVRVCHWKEGLIRYFTKA